MTNITIIGTGYVGLVSGACLAELGHHVTCVDTDEKKIASITAGVMPIYEPKLDALVLSNMAVGRLKVTTDTATAVAGAKVVMIAVGTPPRPEDGQADLTYVYAVTKEIAKSLTGDTLVVTKSTVPIGTGKRIEVMLEKYVADKAARYWVASNPEFLREGSAIGDFMQPERIVIGTTSPEAHEILAEIYAPQTSKGVVLVSVGRETAELIKYASNSFLATKVAFINEMADMCEAVGADIEDVAYGMGIDSRIGEKFLKAGPGFGGSCFPKDTQALVYMAAQYGVEAPITNAVVDGNHARKSRMTQKIINALDGLVLGKKIAVLGLTFKANTDDMRDSPSLVIVPELLAAGAEIIAYDPQGMQEAKHYFSAQNQEKLHFVDSSSAAMTGADACVIITEWDEFKTLTPLDFKTALTQPILVDLRNLFMPSTMANGGVTYVSVGR